MRAHSALKRFEAESGVVGSAQLSMSFTTDSDLAHDLLKEVRRVGRSPRTAVLMQRVKDSWRYDVVLFVKERLTNEALKEWRRLDRAATMESDE